MDREYKPDDPEELDEFDRLLFKIRDSESEKERGDDGKEIWEDSEINFN